MNEENKVPVTQTGDAGKTPEPLQNTAPQRSAEEIAAFNLKKKAEDAKALGLDPKKILGVEPENEVPSWYKEEKAKEAKQTAIQMADSIPDVEDKEKVKNILNTRIIPSGNPEQDFREALSIVSASKNSLIIEEMSRYTGAKQVASGGNVPPKKEEEFVPTQQEKIFMAPPYNIPKEKIIAARKGK